MSSSEKMSDREQRQFWQMVFEAHASSGLSVKQFCKNEGIAEWSFYSWRRKLFGKKQNRSGTDAEHRPGLDEFISVNLPGSNLPACELVFSSGSTLRINCGADSKTLENILTAMKQANLC